MTVDEVQPIVCHSCGYRDDSKTPEDMCPRCNVSFRATWEANPPPEIDFCVEWDMIDKEHFRPNVVFTTYRKRTPEKEEMYHNNIGKAFNITLNGRRIGVARLVQITPTYSYEIPITEIQRTTKGTWSYMHWRGFLLHVYKDADIEMLGLTFAIIESEYYNPVYVKGVEWETVYVPYHLRYNETVGGLRPNHTQITTTNTTYTPSTIVVYEGSRPNTSHD